jgi:serine/threonine-protein kinase HipA
VAETLAVLMGGTVAGTLERTGNNLLRFEYDPAYVADDDATPLSLSMPLAVRVHADTAARRTVSNVLWGLLPDSEPVLDRWARHYQVRASSPFFLLGTPVGEDCAGAVSFCRSDDVGAHLAREGGVEWLTDEDVANLLGDLRRDRTTWLGRDFAGQFSLAGAQAKTALAYEGGRWGRPTGARATTHILKPAGAGWADQDVNEHLCLDAARRAALVAARSRVARFGGETAIVLERYDRVRVRGDVVRVHQEDLCQAMGIHPADKYESNGGPSARSVAALLRRVMPGRDADEAVWRFAEALAWSWIVGGTDAHAKNYSLLLAGGDARLAPLYDISSILPYLGERDADGAVVHERRVRMAMKVGGEADLEPPRDTWPRAAAELGLPADALVARVAALAGAAAGAFAAAAADPAVAGLGSPVAARLVERVGDRAARCLAVLA